MKRIVLALIMVVLPAVARAQVVHEFLYQCTDGYNPQPFIFESTPWAPEVCRPPAPYDIYNVPVGGWGSTPACTNGGSFSCDPNWIGVFYLQTPTHSTGSVLSTNFLILSNGIQQNIPGMSLGPFFVPVNPMGIIYLTPLTLWRIISV